MPGPQDKLEQAMLNRPVKISGDVQYPSEPAPQGPYQRFFGTAMGLEDQQPGDLPSALGAIATMLPFTGLAKSRYLAASRAPAIDDAAAKIIFDHAIDTGIQNSSNRAAREMGKFRVNGAYRNLVERGLAPTENQVSANRKVVSKIMENPIGPAPTGLDAAKHQSIIMSKLMGSGYNPTPDEVSLISRLIQDAAINGVKRRTPMGTGEYVRYIKAGVKPSSELKKALYSIPSWNDDKSTLFGGNWANLRK